VQALLLSPEPFFVAPIPFMSPRAQARGPSAFARLGMTKREACRGMTRWEAVAPRRKPRGLPLGTPSRRKCLMGRRPEGSEGCLGTTGGGHYRGWRFLASLETTEKAVAPCLLFMSPRGASRGVSLETPSRRKCLMGRRPYGCVLWDAVPSEAWDASLSLGMTENGRSEAQSRGTF
jgi:hypothetical protein